MRPELNALVKVALGFQGPSLFALPRRALRRARTIRRPGGPRASVRPSSASQPRWPCSTRAAPCAPHDRCKLCSAACCGRLARVAEPGSGGADHVSDVLVLDECSDLTGEPTSP